MSIRTYPAYPQQVYLPTNSTQGSFTITAGRKALSNSSSGLYLSGSTVHRLIPLNGARGVSLQFFGTDADDEVITAANVWTATFADFTGATGPGIGWESASFATLELFGTTGNITLSTATGAGTGDLVPSTSFIADTIASWAAGSMGAAVEPVYGLGESAIYSPTGNVPASLIIPNFGSLAHAFLVEFDLGTAASGNCLYTLTA